MQFDKSGDENTTMSRARKIHYMQFCTLRYGRQVRAVELYRRGILKDNWYLAFPGGLLHGSKTRFDALRSNNWALSRYMESTVNFKIFVPSMLRMFGYCIETSFVPKTS